MNRLFLDALLCKPVARPAVWLMRQAGRYLPAYQKLRQRYSLETMFTDPSLIEKVTLLPMESLDPDAAIIFSDITTIALALGLQLSFQEGIGPVIYPKIRCKKDVVEHIKPYRPLPFLQEAITACKKQLQKPLIGFCGAPFTVACYFAEKKMLYRDEEGFMHLLRLLTDATKKYLNEQIQSGVDAIQIFDSSAYLLPRHLFQKYSLVFIEELVEWLREKQVPSIVFTRGSCLFKEELIRLQPSCISFDWHESLITLRQAVPSSIAVQGNFDPDLLYASFTKIEEEIQNHLPLKRGIIVNLGHGLKPDMDPEKVRYFVDSVKSYEQSFL